MAVEALSAETQILFVGNSHVFSSIDPDMFSFKTVSLTAGSWNYEAQWAVLKANIKKCPNIKLCVVELDAIPYTLNTLDNRIRRFKGNLSSYLDLGLQYYQIPNLNPIKGFVYAVKEHPSVINIFRKKNKQQNIATVKSTKVINKNCVINKIVKPGFENVDVSIKDSACLASIKEVRQSSLYNYQAKNKKAFIDMLTFLEKKKINILFIRYPRLAPNTVKLQELKNIAGSICKKVLLVDYELDKRFTEHNFRDSNHLNLSGATLLSSLLNDTIKKIAIKENILLTKN